MDVIIAVAAVLVAPFVQHFYDQALRRYVRLMRRKDSS